MRTWWRGLSARRRLLMTVVSALVVVLVAAFVVPRLLSGSPAADTSKPGTVLLIPGYGGSQAALNVLADAIRATGRPAEVVALPGDGTGDLQEQVATLDKDVQQAYAGGAPSVDLIGYSAGGVVARLWVDRNPRGARRVVTLGSPLHGTQIASTGTTVLPDACPTACKQLAVGSALLKQVENRPVPVPWLSVWTEQDQTVIPPTSARLDGAVNVPLQGICPTAQVSHSQLPTDPAVTKLVLQAISADPLSQPTSGVCR
ncbi:lipase [Actinocrispum sp. NPDC049592]|uniref:lipase n=1 Tax=Actinocrispum sp. NPDC049592 TaxID=3154835 RepID=UPI00343E57A0